MTQQFLDSRSLPGRGQGGRNVNIAGMTEKVFGEERATVLTERDELAPKPAVRQSVLKSMGMHVQYVRSTPISVSAAAHLELEKDRIIDTVDLTSAVDAPLGRELTRHPRALEFSLILRAIQPGNAK